MTMENVLLLTKFLLLGMGFMLAGSYLAAVCVGLAENPLKLLKARRKERRSQ